MISLETFYLLYLMVCVFISYRIGLSSGIKLGEYRMKETFRAIVKINDQLRAIKKQEEPTSRSTPHA